MTTPLRHVRRATASAVALALIVALSGTPSIAADPATAASLSGTVLAPDGVSPRVGVRVELVTTTDGAAVAAATTDDIGAFRLAGAPAGTYGLVAHTPAGAFVAADELALAAGVNRPVALTLSDGVPAVAPGQAASQGLPKWARWTIAGTIGVAAAFVIVESSDDVEEPASAF